MCEKEGDNDQMRTRTGGFPIGFIRGGLGREGPSDIADLIAWMKENDLEVVDGIAPEDASAVQAAGLRVGTIGLKQTKALLSADQGKRAEAVAVNAEYIRDNARLGPLNYMVVMLPEDPGLPRAQSFGAMVESYAELTPVLERARARVSIEGWPGPGALCCTPETLRAFFGKCPSRAMGINFDPSHLVRMNIDPLRFLEEFGSRVVHMHGKDTQLLRDNWYEYGTEQPPTFGKPVAFGTMHWRYTIPGHGIVPWPDVFANLAAAGYDGCVSIELEDANFTGSAEERVSGILHGARFLSGC